MSWLQVRRDEIIDLVKVRGALDELAAAEAAAAGTEARIGEIVELNERFTAGSRDPDASVEQPHAARHRLPHAIAVASESSLLPGLLGELNTVFAESRRAAFGLRGRAERSADEHAEIVAAIRDGDPVRAREGPLATSRRRGRRSVTRRTCANWPRSPRAPPTKPRTAAAILHGSHRLERTE